MYGKGYNRAPALRMEETGESRRFLDVGRRALKQTFSPDICVSGYSEFAGVETMCNIRGAGMFRVLFRQVSFL